MIRTLSLLALLMFLAVPAMAEEEEAPAPSEDEFVAHTLVMTAPVEEVVEPSLGLAVGSMAPEFWLHDHEGNKVTLHENLLQSDEGWIVLVTYRGGWCPYCNTHLQALKDVVKPLQEAQGQIVAVSVDLPTEEDKTVAKHGLPYVVLSDPNAQMLEDYNIANRLDDATVTMYKEHGVDLEKSSGQQHHTVAHPAVIIIDPSGMIRFFHVNEDYKLRLTGEEIMTAFNAARAEWLGDRTSAAPPPL